MKHYSLRQILNPFNRRLTKCKSIKRFISTPEKFLSSSLYVSKICVSSLGWKKIFWSPSGGKEQLFFPWVGKRSFSTNYFLWPVNPIVSDGARGRGLIESVTIVSPEQQRWRKNRVKSNWTNDTSFASHHLALWLWTWTCWKVVWCGYPQEWNWIATKQLNWYNVNHWLSGNWFPRDEVGAVQFPILTTKWLMGGRFPRTVSLFSLFVHPIDRESSIEFVHHGFVIKLQFLGSLNSSVYNFFISAYCDWIDDILTTCYNVCDKHWPESMWNFFLHLSPFAELALSMGSL